VVLRPLPSWYLGMTDMDPDEPTATIGISTTIKSGMIALMTLMHELIHLTTPCKGPDHGPRFQKIAKALGIRKPFSEIRNITPELRVRLVEIRNKLGRYPEA